MKRWNLRRRWGKHLCPEGTVPDGRDAVRIHFQERPWDLVVAIGYTLVMAGALLAGDAGHLLPNLRVPFVPGDVNLPALFPGQNVIGWGRRIYPKLRPTTPGRPLP